jgi:bifunctional non-homologous end joining protein LigD
MKKAALPRRSSGSKPDARLERITHPDRVVFTEAGITKVDVAAYYLAVADRILPYLAKRPISFIRAPEGLGGEIFFQRHLLKGMSKGIQQVPDPGKEHADWVAIRDAEGLLTCAQFGIIELHGWGSTLPKLGAPDRVVFDLDPDPSVTFANVQAAALELRRLLGGIDLQSFPLLSGGKGIHVVVPLDRTQDWDTIADFASGMAQGLAETDPKRYVAVASKSKRRGRIYIDWLRNRMTATAIVPWSLRARQEASVAVPVTWREMQSARSATDFRIADAVRRRDPWKTFFATKQRIPKRLADFLGGKAKRR